MWKIYSNMHQRDTSILKIVLKVFLWIIITLAKISKKYFSYSFFSDYSKILFFILKKLEFFSGGGFDPPPTTLADASLRLRMQGILLAPSGNTQKVHFNWNFY